MDQAVDEPGGPVMCLAGGFFIQLKGKCEDIPLIASFGYQRERYIQPEILYLWKNKHCKSLINPVDNCFHGFSGVLRRGLCPFY